MNDLFLLGDPRFLSDGGRSPVRPSYDRAPARLEDDSATVTTGDVAQRCTSDKNAPPADLSRIVRSFGQSVHRGKGDYHSRPNINVFLRKADEGEPSVGVELETLARSGASYEDIEADLCSNWFHFEHDGSLGDSGYECITEPLGPRYYRDPKLWEGLQNVLSPWLYSWGTNKTGLHVHVGFDMMFNLPHVPTLPFSNISLVDKRNLARMIVVYVYYSIVDQSLTDAVFLRQNRYYCGNNVNGEFLSRIPANDGTTAREIVQRAWAAMANVGRLVDAYANAGRTMSSVPSNVTALSKAFATVSDDSSYGILTMSPEGTTGHSSELNTDHRFTIEFRRGKGTLNAASVLRIVEFTTHIVKYAFRILTDGDMVPSSQDFYKFLAESTTSKSLADMAGKLLKGK